MGVMNAESSAKIGTIIFVQIIRIMTCRKLILTSPKHHCVMILSSDG
jgi:hypothetical protein